ncbi:hypothetical protein RFI_08471 [Reticulomyxa filosa]|uniref:Uncharacterized protein n=1 Tax=Reticulomyxa filosa TaxID=46433 RepID=X6NQT2_RETFI|nr:hypothetical protein RFI_08471 [Reticulomyxa filosa]|eukprot:ETO28660.1 hypothetical protein RFI_08471 [Reticulomyxa filosa]
MINYRQKENPAAMAIMTKPKKQLNVLDHKNNLTKIWISNIVGHIQTKNNQKKDNEKQHSYIHNKNDISYFRDEMSNLIAIIDKLIISKFIKNKPWWSNKLHKQRQNIYRLKRNFRKNMKSENYKMYKEITKKK